jgi:hypothetical protein
MLGGARDFPQKTAAAARKLDASQRILSDQSTNPQTHELYPLTACLHTSRVSALLQIYMYIR